MGQTRQSINETLQGRRILGVRFGSRWRFPSVQFRHHEPLPGLSPVLKATGDLEAWLMLEVLLAPSEPPDLQAMRFARGAPDKPELGSALEAAIALMADWQATGVPGSGTQWKAST
jgi:hypothetical protein